MNNIPKSISLTCDEFLEFSKNALLGNLCEGYVHAVNNALSSISSQLDVLTILKSENELKQQINQLINECDSYTRLLKHFYNVIITIQVPRQILNATAYIESLFVSLTRIYRRQNLKWIFKTPNQLIFVKYSVEFAQVILRLCLGVLDIYKPKTNIIIESHIDRKGDAAEFMLYYPIREVSSDKIKDTELNFQDLEKTILHFRVIELIKQCLIEKEPNLTPNIINSQYNFEDGILTLKWLCSEDNLIY